MIVQKFGINPVRLLDVARAAKVSRSTASNVFSNPERVGPKLRQRVEAAAKAMGYAGPDPKGRILRAGKINVLGVLSPLQMGVADTLRNPVFAQFLQGVAQTCDEAGVSLLIVPDLPGKNGIASALVDGFIFGRIEHLDQLDAANRRRLPYAVVDFDAGPTINSVSVDAHSGAKAAALHLLELGHRRFGIMSFLRDSGSAKLFPVGRARDPTMAGIQVDQKKLEGYADALAEYDLNIDDVAVVQAGAWDPDAAGIMLDAAPEATAILSMSVMQAIAIIHEARRRGIKVPDELAVVGFNDIPEAALCQPPLTTVDSLTREKGRAAAELVLAGASGQQISLSSHLIIRGSTAPPRS
jgi:DNA-binding LacI/PurR family transcriptional regulator